MRRREFIAGLGGAAAVWPAVARAQLSLQPAIGYLSGGKESSGARLAVDFRRGLGETGYVDGRNVEILYRYAEAQYERVTPMAVELVRRQVTVIVAVAGTASVLAAKSATVSIPIVLANGADPVALGLVASLNRPGRNITGVSFLTTAITGKRLELLRATVPTAASVGYLINPTQPNVEDLIREAEQAAHGVHLIVLNAGTPQEIETALSQLRSLQIGALLVDADPLFTALREQIVGLTGRLSVPAMYAYHEYVEVGGLMSYGTSLSEAYRLVGTYAGRVLKGEKPADLPVQQSTKVDLVINLKTAKSLGLTFPLSLLARADEVIE
jgi:putative tryptophan/tyrosine transport system substrate-binding protein